MFETCTNCGVTLVGGRRDENGIFCSKECQSWFRHPGYCPTCWAATTDQQADYSVTVNGIGARMYGARDRCPVCNSVIQSYCLCFLYIPVWRLGRYRVLYQTRGRRFSRKLSGPE